MLWVRTGRVGRVGTAGVDRVEALDLVAQIAYVRGGSAGREREDVGYARRRAWRHGGRRGNDVGAVAATTTSSGAVEAAAVRCGVHGAETTTTTRQGSCRQAVRQCRGLGGD